jgi:hypothetical protein
MAGITREEYRASAARGLDLRDVVGAWVVCALVASIALAVSSDFHFHAPPASASVVTALMQPTPGNREMPLTARK